MLRELLAAEWQWLQGLTPEQREEVFSESDTDFPLDLLLRAGRVALVLARANPCALLNNKPDRQDEFGPIYYSSVLGPWYEKHKEYLEDLGFTVEFIDDPVYVIGPAGLIDYGGAALLQDKTSDKNELVNKIFHATRTPFCFTWSEEETVTWKDLDGCLSYKPTKMGNQATGSNVSYYFKYSKQVFGGEELCCSPIYHSKIIHPSDAKAVGDHFHKCYKAMLTLGFPIKRIGRKRLSQIASGLHQAMILQF